MRDLITVMAENVHQEHLADMLTKVNYMHAGLIYIAFCMSVTRTKFMSPGIILRSQLANFNQFWIQILILTNFDLNFAIPEKSVNHVRKDLACMLGFSGKLCLAACPAPICFACVRFSQIFARPECSLNSQTMAPRVM